MLNFYENTKIYVVSPGYKTGGPKSLHTLANILCNYGYEVYIYYNKCYNGQKKSIYEDCKAIVTEKIEDDKNNILIIPEADTNELYNYKNIQKVIWWLSLDYYAFHSIFMGTSLAIKRKGLPSFIYPFFLPYKFIQKKRNNEFTEDYIKTKKEFSQAYHMYNCEYVRLFLKKKCVCDDNMHYLCGPLEQDYLHIEKNSIVSKKENIVAYNPAKVEPKYIASVIEEIKKINSNIKFVKIQGMNKSQVQETLSKTKVYADFGFFPGPERMPREAVSLYCNIVTSTLGAANNSEDVKIPQKYKFSVKKKSDVKNAANLIVDMVDNFDKYTSDFDEYRKVVKNQILRFSNDVEEIFKINNK